MLLTIIIPTGRSATVDRTIDSALHQEIDGFEVEILVVANPPCPALEARLAARPQRRGFAVRYVPCAERGANRARNAGVDEARGDLLYFLDDDCLLPDPRHLAKLRLAHALDHTASGIGGRYLSPRNAPSSCVHYNAFIESWLRSNARADGHGHLVLPGGNASFKRAVFDEGGRFDPSIVYGGDETTFCHDLIRAGHRLMLDPGLDVVHDFRGTWRSLLVRAFRHGRGRRLHPPPPEVTQLRMPRPARWPVDATPRPRALFAAYLAAHWIAVRCGALLTARAATTTTAAPPPAGARERERAI